MPDAIRLAVLTALVSCTIPERGIDNTRIVGTLRIEPATYEETSDQANDLVQAALNTGELFYGYLQFTGTLTDLRTDPTSGAPIGDADYWMLISPVARGADNPLAVDVTLSDSTALARIRVFNLDETSGPLNEPTLVYEEDFSGWTLAEFEAEPDVRYAFGIIGIDGAAPVDYTAFAFGQHPDEANVLVGAYTGADAEDRGSLLAGTNAKPWVQDGLAFETWYEMLLVREFHSDEDGHVEVLDENVKQAWIYAGTWANLSQTLPAGTWYSKRPVLVDLTGPKQPELHGTPPKGFGDDPGDKGDDPAEPLIKDTPRFDTVHVDTPVVLDKIAPAMIGQVWDEATTEPNDTDIGDAFDNPDGAYDLGVLSGPGFVDIIENGSLTDNGYNYWTGDNDTFKFQVPEPLFLNFTLSWDDPAHDLDIVLVDAEGNLLDQGYYGFPEIPEVGTEILQPGQDYYLGVLLWIGTGNEGDTIGYELSLEQLP